jgi:hypothetical protein
MSDKKHVEKKNQTENCIMWLHLYSKLLLFKLLHMLFSWFTKFHGFMILTRNHENWYSTNKIINSHYQRNFTWTREVWSKGAVTWYNFLFGFSFQHAFCQTFQHRLVSYIHLTVWEEFLLTFIDF